MTSQYFSDNISGGAVGGYINLENYADSVLSKDKELFIKNLTEDITKVMKTDANLSNLHTKSIDDLLKIIKINVPDIKMNQKLKNDPVIMNKIADGMAKVINERYGKQIIDTQKSLHEKCIDIEKFLRSLTTGLKSEFVGVSKDINRIMSNIAILKNTLDSGFNKLNNLINESDDSSLEFKSAGISALYKDVQMELDRQLAILNNLLDTTMDPTTKTIVDLDEKTTQMTHIVNNIRSESGTKVANLLAGVDNAAHMANTVDKSLKEIGLTVSDYKTSKNLDDLINKAYSVWQNKHDNPNANEVGKFIKALEIIKSSNYSHADIAKYLDEKPSRSGGKHNKNHRGYKGGLAGPNSLEKRMERQKKTRELLLSDFNRRLEQQNKIIKMTLAKLMPKFGATIDIDDHLNEFVKAFSSLTNETDLDRTDFYYALSGFRTDAVSKDERSRYMGKLEAISKSLKPLCTGTNGEYFKNVKDAIDEEVRIIDNFNDVFLKPATTLLAKDPSLEGTAIGVMGGNMFDEDESRLDNIAGDESSSSDDDNSEDENISYRKNEPIHSKYGSKYGRGVYDATAYTSLKELSEQLTFYYKTAQVRRSLDIAAKDIGSFSNDYKSILGDSIGYMIQQIRTEGENWISNMESDTGEGKIVKDWIGTDSSKKASFDAAIKFKREQISVKTEMLKTIEAIDLYLMNFANAIASNPEDIKDLPELLKSVTIITKWFSEGSGDNITALFDNWPASLSGTEDIFVTLSDAQKDTIIKAKNNTQGNHYYEWVGGLVTAGSLPGNPFLGVLPGVKTDGKNFIDKVLADAQTAMMTNRVLDNIMSTFTYMGSKFNNVNVNNTTFMTTGVMLKNIRKYIYMSSIVMGFQGDSNVNNNVRSGHVDLDKINIKAGVSMNKDIDNTPNDDAERHVWSHGQFGIAMTSIPNVDTVDEKGNITKAVPTMYNGYVDTWSTVDDLFIMSMKAIVAKIFTVIGTYGVFNKPLMKYTSLGPTRMILGGSINTPEIIPGAVEAYIRLPLLAEFYRDQMKFTLTSSDDIIDPKTNLNTNTGNRKIALVPELEGIWQSFIKIIFEDARFVSQGNYSDSQVNSIITEINNIYKKFKTSTDRSTTIDIIQHFVAEINRRYGVVKQSEINTYLKDKFNYTHNKEYKNRDDKFDFNLLDEEEQSGRLPAPSDSYDNSYTSLKTTKRVPDNIYSKELRNLVIDFRSSIDNEIKKLLPNVKTHTYDESIRQYKSQIENAKDNSEKYRIILRALQGNDQLSVIGNYKAIMFHEMIQAPLDTLYTMWTILNQFSEKSQEFNIKSMESAIDHVLDAGGVKDYNDFANEFKKNGTDRYLFKGYTPDIIVNDKSIYHSHTKADVSAKNNILVYRGTYGMEPCEYNGKFAHHLTWDLLSAVASKYNNNKENISEGVKRFIIDREELLKDMLNVLFSLSSNFNDLVTVKAQGTNLVVDFANLADNVSGLLIQIRKNIEKFRGQVDEAIIKRAEGGSSTNKTGGVARTVGSLSWLEEQLMERLLKGSRDSAAFDIKTKLNMSMPQISEMLDNTYKNLAKKWTVLARVTCDNNKTIFDKPSYRNEKDPTDLDKALYNQELTLLETSYDNCVSELLYWSPNSKVQGSGNVNISNEIKDDPEIPLTRNYSSITSSHTLLRGDKIRNTQNIWPFYTVPSIDILNSTDEEIKVYKELNDRLTAFKGQYLGLVKNLYVSNAADIIGTYIDNDPGVITNPSLMVYSGSNNHVNFQHIDIHHSKFPDIEYLETQDTWNAAVANNNLKSKMKELIDLMQNYNAEFLRRDELLKVSYKIPIFQRENLYEDPNGDSDESGYLMGQLDTTLESGLLIRFNQFLSRYLNLGWDITSKKMYRNLIEKFANGTHSDATIQGNAINDININLFTNKPTNVGIPSSHTTVFASLARFMRNVLLKTKRGSNDPEYRMDTLTDVPIYMKENYRSGLVAFDKMFKLLIKKAEMIKSLTGHFSVVRQTAFLDSYGVHNGKIDFHNIIANSNGIQMHFRKLDEVGIHDQLEVTNNWLNYANRYPSCLPFEINNTDCVYVPTATYFRNINLDQIKDTAWIKGNGGIDKYIKYMNNRCDNKNEMSTYKGFSPFVFLNKENARQWINSLNDDIVNAANSITKCAQETYRELADEPKFLETHEGFIIDYNNNHKMQPLMLLSQTQLILRNRFKHNSSNEFFETEWDNDTKSGYARPNYLLPFHKNGSQSHKLLYGCRLILNRPDIVPTLEFMPGMQTLLDKYNGTCTPDMRMDKPDFEKFTISHNELLRFINDLKFYKPLLDVGSGGCQSTDNRIASCLFDVPLSTADVAFPKEQRDYAMKHTLDEVIDITESSDQEESIREIISSISSKSTSGFDNRAQARIYNIIDMNIVPINVHALVRDIPLANIINYSYTADRMIQDALLPNGLPGSEFKLIDTAQPSGNTRHLMCKMLLNPYVHLNEMEYYGLFARIVTGDSGLGLERPKFISDQLWNKSLFGDQYTLSHVKHDKRPDESGPRSDNAQNRFQNDENGTVLILNSFTHASFNEINDTTSSTFLQYIKHDDETNEDVIQQVNNITSAKRKELANLGRLRFNTKFIRDNLFLVQLQRLMRLVMRNEIDELGAPLANDTAVLNRQITEYINNEKFDGSVFRTPNIKE